MRVAAGIAVECNCRVNGRVLEDDVEGSARPYYASDCRDAAQRMADGDCIERLDCCFTYPGPDGVQFCACTADPTYVVELRSSGRSEWREGRGDLSTVRRSELPAGLVGRMPLGRRRSMCALFVLAASVSR